jgi:hypothetical protein
MVSYFSYIEHIKRLHKKFHDFTTLLKLIMKFTSLGQKQEKEKEKPRSALFTWVTVCIIRPLEKFLLPCRVLGRDLEQSTCTGNSIPGSLMIVGGEGEA